MIQLLSESVEVQFFVRTSHSAPVFHIHDGARGAVYKLGKVLLRPALFLQLAFDFPTQGMKIKIFFILVHFYITSISFYISGEHMRTKYNFIFR